MKSFHFLLTIGLFLCFCGGAKTAPTPREVTKGDSVSFLRIVVKSPVFVDGGTIPVRCTGDGEDISPELVWDSVPAGVKSFALLSLDPDAPLGTLDQNHRPVNRTAIFSSCMPLIQCLTYQQGLQRGNFRSRCRVILSLAES